jgi:hypothetical protein
MMELNNDIQHNSQTHQTTCVPTRTGDIRTTPSQSLASSATKIETEILLRLSVHLRDYEKRISNPLIIHHYVLAGALYRNPDP